VTKKDYRAFAEMLHERRRRSSDSPRESALLDGLARDMCQIFARDNSRFSSERFLTAVREGLGCKK
jgi:hypothetical protein